MSHLPKELNSSLEEVLAFRKMMFETSIDLVRLKGADYNRDQQEAGDTLFNLRVCELLGIVDTVEQGILVRLSDKLMRLISLTKTPGREAAVTDEKVRDTARDVHNYVDYLVLLHEKRSDSRRAEEKITSEKLIADIDEQENEILAAVDKSLKTCDACKGYHDRHTYDEHCMKVFNAEERKTE